MSNVSNQFSFFNAEDGLMPEFQLDAFEASLQERSSKSIKSITFSKGVTAKDKVLTEAQLVLSNGHVLTLGTIYGRPDKVGNLHPVSSYYKENDKITDALKPVQRKGVQSAADMLAELYGLDKAELCTIINESRNFKNYID